jgi:hypothetical protein
MSSQPQLSLFTRLSQFSTFNLPLLNQFSTFNLPLLNQSSMFSQQLLSQFSMFSQQLQQLSLFTQWTMTTMESLIDTFNLLQQPSLSTVVLNKLELVLPLSLPQPPHLTLHNKLVLNLQQLLLHHLECMSNRLNQPPTLSQLQEVMYSQPPMLSQ